MQDITKYVYACNEAQSPDGSASAGVALMRAKVQRPASTDLDPRIAVTGQADYAAIAAASSSHCERFAQKIKRFTDVEGSSKKRNTNTTTTTTTTKGNKYGEYHQRIVCWL
jgi:hypothetical protein